MARGAIKIRVEDKADLLGYTLDTGEPCLAIGNGVVEFWIGTPGGNERIGTTESWNNVAGGIEAVDLTDGDVPVYDAATDKFKMGSATNLDHGGLDGLGDDDHEQYHTDARAKTWAEASALGTRTLNLTLGDGVSPLEGGENVKAVHIPFGGIIVAAGIETVDDLAGDAVVDIWRAASSPTDADSITGGNELTLSDAQSMSDTDLTGWTTAINAGDSIKVYCDSGATTTSVTVYLEIQVSV
jgi:hypothetical protein